MSIGPECIADAARRLREADARTEALAEFVPERRVLGIRRAARMRQIGRVWRLGVLLVSTDGELFATGSVTRAVPPGRKQFQAVSIEERREYRAASFRSGFAEGEVVNFDASPVAWESPSPPLVKSDGEWFVQWSASTSALAELSAYVNDRVELLVNPPSGA